MQYQCSELDILAPLVLSEFAQSGTSSNRVKRGQSGNAALQACLSTTCPWNMKPNNSNGTSKIERCFTLRKIAD